MSLFGNSQTLTYGSGAGLIQVSLTNDNFVPTSGEGHLPWLGYHRQNDPAHLLKITRTAMGAAAFAAPVYRPMQTLVFNLRLDQPQILGVWGMSARQQLEKLPVVLDDQRLAMLEPSPRIRAKIGSVSGVTPPANCEVFWPRLAILLTVQDDWTMIYNCAQTEGHAIVRMTATEMFILEAATYDLP